MISALNRKLERQRRDKARAPLVALLRSCAGHAMKRYAGLPLTVELVRRCQDEVAWALLRLAARGTFAYFGIADELGWIGAPAPRLVVIAAPPYGQATIEVAELVAWIFAGGANGWGDARGFRL